MRLSISFIRPDMDLNEIDNTISRILTILPTLFVTTKRFFFNKNVNILLVKGEVITILSLFTPIPLLSS